MVHTVLLLYTGIVRAKVVFYPYIYIYYLRVQLLFSDSRPTGMVRNARYLYNSYPLYGYSDVTAAAVEAAAAASRVSPTYTAAPRQTYIILYGTVYTPASRTLRCIIIIITVTVAVSLC